MSNSRTQNSDKTESEGLQRIIEEHLFLNVGRALQPIQEKYRVQFTEDNKSFHITEGET